MPQTKAVVVTHNYWRAMSLRRRRDGWNDALHRNRLQVEAA